MKRLLKWTMLISSFLTAMAEIIFFSKFFVHAAEHSEYADPEIGVALSIFLIAVVIGAIVTGIVYLLWLCKNKINSIHLTKL